MLCIGSSRCRRSGLKSHPSHPPPEGPRVRILFQLASSCSLSVLSVWLSVHLCLSPVSPHWWIWYPAMRNWKRQVTQVIGPLKMSVGPDPCPFCAYTVPRKIHTTRWIQILGSSGSRVNFMDHEFSMCSRFYLGAIRLIYVGFDVLFLLW